MTFRRFAAATLMCLSVATAPPLLALNRPDSIPVPYVSQSEQLCGGAAVAMVLRFYGARDVVAEDFAGLVEPEAHGIRVSRLVDAVQARGWNAVALEGTAANVRERLAQGQPVIALVAASRDRYHYVVITSWTDSGVIVQDPAVGPDHRYSIHQFDQAWAKSDRTIVVIVPSDRIAVPSMSPNTAAREGSAPTPCDGLVASAVERAHAGNSAAAEQLLNRAAIECPASSAPVRELAGLRLTQTRFKEAAAFAGRAVNLDPSDREAWRLLGAAEYLDRRPGAALDAWNQIGEPRLDLVRVEGLDRSRYDAVADMVAVAHGEVISRDDLDLARRRIASLPAIAAARVDVEPRGQGAAQIDVAVVERPTFPRSIPEAGVVALRAGIDREVAVAVNDLTGFGDVLAVSYRWWENRPRTAVSFAAPGLFGTAAVWRLEASWETQSYAAGGPAAAGEHRRRAALGVSGWSSPALRWDVSSGVDRWDAHGAFGFVGGELEHRSRDDRFGVHASATLWAGGSSFGTTEIAADFSTSTSPIGWRMITTGGVAAASVHSVMDVWPGAGTGHAREALLRAHPLLDDGIVTGGAFGRTLEHATVELQRWPRTARLWNIGAAAFVDAAAAQHRLESTTAGAFADLGVGVRIRAAWLPGTLRIDYAHGLTDQASALSVGFSR